MMIKIKKQGKNELVKLNDEYLVLEYLGPGEFGSRFLVHTFHYREDALHFWWRLFGRNTRS